ncbi:MAG: hypothetical protein FJ319_00415 [SAR202 cluster bacterium]|nr:hypothetical protein [SAR202 cluster bacterium]
MEVRPGKRFEPIKPINTRGSGPAAKLRRANDLGPRKAVILRMPEDVAHKLKIVSAHEDMTAQDFCMQAIMPHIQRAMRKHGLDTLKADDSAAAG